MTAKPHRRWFSFSLRTLFLLVTLCGTIGYLLFRKSEVWRARKYCEQTNARVEIAIAGFQEACEASLQLFYAEAAVPFADRHKAAVAHHERVEQIWLRGYGPTSEWMMGVSDDASLARATAKMNEIERYRTDAARLVAENP